MSAHPMIVPLAGREAASSLPTVRAQQVFLLLHDAVEAFANPPPVWEVQRYTVSFQNKLYALEKSTLLSHGWRQGSYQEAPLSYARSWLPASFPIQPGRAVAIRTSFQPLPRQPVNMTVLLTAMVQRRIGRPSTYASHVGKLFGAMAYVTSVDDMCLSAAGEARLSALRQSEMRHIDAAFCGTFEDKLDAIERGTETPSGLLQWALGEQGIPLGKWIENLDIGGTPAAMVYEARDHQARTTIEWDAQGIPPNWNPELLLAKDTPERQRRVEINTQTAERVGDQWLSLDALQRAELRIETIAHAMDISIAQWKERHRFDLLARWIVGWIA